MKNTYLVLILISLHLNTCHPKVTIVNFIAQEISAEQLSNHSSLRDLPFPKYRFKELPLVLILKALAEKLNISNVVTKTWHNPKVLKTFTSKVTEYVPTNQITILTYINTLASGALSPLYQWERFVGLSYKPIYFSAGNMECNFVYCDMPRWRKEPVWSLRVLASVFDSYTWIILAIMLILVAQILGAPQFERNLVLLISAVLSGSPSGTP